MNEKKQYTISQIADELEISTRTIRFYEEKGLIKTKKDGRESTDLYSEEQGKAQTDSQGEAL